MEQTLKEMALRYRAKAEAYANASDMTTTGTSGETLAWMADVHEEFADELLLILDKAKKVDWDTLLEAVGPFRARPRLSANDITGDFFD